MDYDRALSDECGKVVALAGEIEAIALASGLRPAAALAQSRISITQVATALRSRHALTRVKALFLLSYFEVAEALPLLANVLRHDRSPLVRHEAAYFLGATRSEDAVDVLAAALIEDENELVRHEAAEALGEHGSVRGRHALEKALNDRSDVVAETAAVALDRLKASIHDSSRQPNHV